MARTFGRSRSERENASFCGARIVNGRDGIRAAASHARSADANEPIDG
jgi:secreted trypsin-like serine protease